MFDSGLTRFELNGEVEHKDGQQFVNGKGFAGDVFERVHRPEPHGFASHPVRGGVGFLLAARNNRDSAYMLGGENPAMRPMLELGGVAIYDNHENIVSIVARSLRIVHSSTIYLKAPNIVLDAENIRLGGPGASRPMAVEGTLDSAGHAAASNFATGVFGI